MRVIKKALPIVGLVPETPDDIWHLEKVVEKGDLVTSWSERRFKTESGKSDRKTIKVKVRVESIEYHKDSKKLRLLGTVVEGHPLEYVTIGAHHTVEVMPDSQLYIEKQRWNRYHLDRIDQAVKASKKPKLLIVVLDDEEAEFALLRDYGLERKGTIRSGKTGKAFPSSAKSDYFQQVHDTMASAEKAVVAGPGFTKENFSKWMLEHDPALHKRCLFADIGGTGSPGMQEVLKKGIVDRIIKESRVSMESTLVEELLSKIPSDNAVYGLGEVEEALDYGAAEKLLLTDDFFSENRDASEKLMNKAERTSCEAHVISTEHESGERLKHLGGVAATLRFKTG